MRSRITLGKYLVYCLLVFLIAYIIIDASMRYMAFQMNFWIIAGIIVGVNALLYVFYSYPITGIVVGGLIPVSLVGYYIIWTESFRENAGYVWDIIKESSIWIYEYMFGLVPIDKLYMNIVTIVFIVFVTILLFFLAIAKRWVVFTLSAGVVYLSFMWYFGLDDAFGYVQKFVFACFALYGYVHFDKLETGWRLRQDRYSKKIIITWAVCLLVSLGLIFITTEIFPKKIDAVSIQWLNDNVFSKLPGYGSGRKWGGGRFSIGTVGFQQGPSKLGGSVKVVDRKLFEARIDGSVSGPIYLRGAIKDDYSGTMWAKGYTAYTDGITDQEIEGLMGDDSLIKDSSEATVTIYPGSFSTTTMFSLWKPYRVEADSVSYTAYEDGEMYHGNTSAASKEYKVVSKIPAIYTDDLKKSGKSYNDEEFLRYLEVSDSLPNRVKTLTHNIADSHSTDYEKADAIQNYLRQNYPYTLDTSEVPDGRDFVDYFLFDEKQGYCTYYASAMAVMCRVVGIPSRYVEGFILDSSDRGDDGIYDINASRAHAWVELYFDGYGWVLFEPTSAYSAPGYEKSAPVLSELPSTDPVENGRKEAIDNPRGKQLEDGMEEGVVSTGQTKDVPWELYIGLSIAAIILIRVFIKLLISWSRVKKADRMKNKDAVIEYFGILERKLKYGGLYMDIGETPAEFAQRVFKYLSGYGVDLIAMVDIFNRVRYGSNVLDDSARNRLKHAIKAADKLMKFRMGFIKYIAVKYLL